MTTLCLSLIALSFLIACPMTAVMRSFGARLGQMDNPGERKIHSRPIPATGGVAIFWAIALPFAIATIVPFFAPENLLPASLLPHLPGLKSQTPLAATLLGCLLILHVTGLVDDRKPLGPLLKLAIQLGVAAAVVVLFEVRLLELLGTPFSIIVTVLWFVAITNAFNFLDNMDGLSSGVGCICASLLLATALISGQWFIAALLALLVGALLGFLVFNFPPATIFMGDGGSLVLGYVLAFCSVRITYFDETVSAVHTHWWAVFTPVVILAIPLYDLTSVTLLRLSQGRNPMVGDTQHFSHRLVRKGLSRRASVGVIWACTFATGVSGVMLAYLSAWQATIVLAQTGAILLILMLLESKVHSKQELL